MSLDSLVRAFVVRVATQFNTQKALINGKEPALPGGGGVAQYLRGDKTWRTLASDAEPPIAAGTAAQYWRGDKSWQTLNPAAVGAEPTLPGGGTVSQYLRGDKTWQDYIQSTNAGFVNSISTANHALTGLQTVGGVAVGAGGRVLLVAQTDAKENGIWLVGSGAWVRATDANTSARLGGYVATVSQGPNIATVWRTTFKPTDTIGTNNIRFYRTSVEMIAGPLNYPVPALDGHTIFDKTNKMHRVYDATAVQWVSSNGVIQDTQAVRLAMGFPAGNVIFRETDTGQVYMWDGATWQNIIGTTSTLHRCHVALRTAQSIPNGGSSTAINFDTELEDTSGMWASGTPSLITIPETGKYLLVGRVGTTQAAGIIHAYFGVSGQAWQFHRATGSSASPTLVSGSMEVNLVAGDTVNMLVFQNSGAAVTTHGSTQYGCDLIVMKLPDSQVTQGRQVQAACQIFKTTAQNFPTSGTGATLTFDSVRFDTDGMADTANNRIVIQHEGIYRLYASTSWATNATGYRQTQIQVNGTEVTTTRGMASSSAGSYGYQTSISLDLNVGDVITVNAAQASGGALSTLADTAYRCWLGAEIISDTIF